MSATMVAGDQVEACCADRSNRLRIHARQPAGWRVELCGVCGRRHITVFAREAPYTAAKKE